MGTRRQERQQGPKSSDSEGDLGNGKWLSRAWGGMWVHLLGWASLHWALGKQLKLCWGTRIEAKCVDRLGVKTESILGWEEVSSWNQAQDLVWLMLCPEDGRMRYCSASLCLLHPSSKLPEGANKNLRFRKRWIQEGSLFHLKTGQADCSGWAPRDHIFLRSGIYDGSHSLPAPCSWGHMAGGQWELGTWLTLLWGYTYYF